VTDKVIVSLLIAIIGLLLALILLLSAGNPFALADTGASDIGLVAVTGNTEAQNRDLVWVFDPKAKSLCVYDLVGGRLQLVAARNIKFDLLLDEWRPGSQTPGVKDVYNETKKKRAGEEPPERK
jgi:uncharacterized protein (UPF0333 family)